jgi:3-phosphoshikimate 1-carboxyvinyltransferase
LNKSYPKTLHLPRTARAVGVVDLPGSKSISNRVLLLAALAQGTTTLTNLLDSDDTKVMLDALRALGVTVSHDAAARSAVIRSEGFTVKQASLFLGNAGTAVRPLTAVLALMGGEYRLHGVPRMHERPIADLITALRALGCNIRCEANEGFLPLHIGKPKLDLSQPVRVRGDVSSQFLSALLLALPLVAQRDVIIEVTTELISKPYVEITLALLQKFGVHIQREGWQRFVVPAGSRYQSPGSLAVEGDASSASYLLAAGVIAGGPVTARGAGASSIQGDVAFAKVLESLGGNIQWQDNAITAQGLKLDHSKLKGGTVDCLAIPDAAMTLAVLGLVCDTPLTLTGIASWRVKETDRIAAMVNELTRIGAKVSSTNDSLTVHPAKPGQLHEASIHTYDDHRMAMCFSLVPLLPDVGTSVTIEDPACVAKTFPEYFQVWQQLCSSSH